MAIKSDRWITRMAREHGMIEPFVERQTANGAVSFGVSSYGYDIRVGDEFKIFTNVNSSIIDPKAFDAKSFIDFKGPVCIVPPNSFALAKTVEYFRIPRNVLTVCVGKCVTADTQVVDASTGRLVPITDLLSGRGATASVHGNQAIKRADVTEGAIQGVLPVYRVVTRSGRTVRATPNHPLLTFGGWRPLQELQVGDRIGVPRHIPIFGSRELPEHEVDLLGLMISDGQCSTPGSSPRYTSGDPVLRDYFSRAVERFGGVPRAVGVYSVNATNRGHRGGIMVRNRMAVWLESFGLAVHSPDKQIPAAVFELTPRLLARFLRALFSGDGGVSISGEGIHLEFCSTSEPLARGLQHLLLRFGILTQLRWRPTASGRGAFVVVTTSKEQIIRFAEQIGFVPGSQKQKRLEEALMKIEYEPQQKSNFDTLPREAWAVVRHACQTQGVSLRQMGLREGRLDQSVPRGLVRHVAQRLSDEALGRLVDSDLLWDTIRDIRFDGMEPVYDLTLPETANFVANDIVVHNSTYARCGIIVNVTPFEPEWEGFVTLEISNTTPLPAKIYANEGIAQVLFFESDEQCAISYRDRKGKYQGQQTITLPKVSASSVKRPARAKGVRPLSV